MAQLVVRGLQDEVKRRLQARATRHGQSMEAEVRDILRDAIASEQDDTIGLGTRITSLFKGIGLKPGEELQKPNWGEMKSPFEE